MDIPILIITLLASAFFSGLEFAFISANKLKIELKKKQGGWTGKALEKYYSKPSRFLGTILVGNNIALVIFGIVMANLLEPKLQNVFGRSELATNLAQTLIATPVILLAGEFIPKNLFRLNPSGALSVLAAPFIFLYGLLWMPVVIVVFIAKLLLKALFGISYEEEEKQVFGKVDLQHYIRLTQTAHAEQIDTTLFEKALDLDRVKVRECMVPRTEIQAIEENDEFDIIKQKFLETRHSKIIVYKENIDQVTGYIHHQDLLHGKTNVWEITPVPESMPADDLLDMFITERKSIAWVVDEYGGTAGIVTLEDIIEEIFGEIHDEHDSDDLKEKKLSEKLYEFSARLEIDYLNEQYNFLLPEGEYETLAGCVINHFGRIPKKGEKINIGPYEFEILEASTTRIESIKMKILPI